MSTFTLCVQLLDIPDNGILIASLLSVCSLCHVSYRKHSFCISDNSLHCSIDVFDYVDDVFYRTIESLIKGFDQSAVKSFSKRLPKMQVNLAERQRMVFITGNREHNSSAKIRSQNGAQCRATPTFERSQRTATELPNTLSRTSSGISGIL